MKNIGTIQKGTINSNNMVNIGGQTIPIETSESTFKENEEVQVFLYLNKEGNLVASETLPEATVDSFGWAEVVSILPHLGAFVNIGVEGKDILVSKDELPAFKSVWPKEGDHLFVSLERDKKGRLEAKPITEEEVMEDLEKAPEELLNKEAAVRVYKATKAGTAVLTEEGYRGFIHPDERKEEPRLGEDLTARVIAVKEDGTLNLSLRPVKKWSQKEDAELIYEYLEDNDGVMYFTDKSDATEIRDTFNISKSAFKRALGKLMKEDKVIQEQDRTVIKHT
ncbi:CvfB family protein [Salimicrobium halophilum]|uniref:S1 motif domain-containing protein n=1 Tax=Salimicrobium halophilum TaxID=86666 RepID=A0A1G8Q491_9BACI|nr:hypothetical protein [Salimicrobium halophilum]SDI99562.1 hypothetical protein SAMN04490247_0389 [Salimicrobium halophilum]